MEISVLRLGHRLPRDERISTHVALVARAFGASSISYTGQHDAGLEDSVKRICENWGGKVPMEYAKSHTSFIRKAKADGFTVVHLTMYGMPLQQKAAELRKLDKVLVVVGSEQVPGEVYELADFNVSVTNQPHSEVAALAIALDRLVEGKELLAPADGGLDFGGRMRIVPSERGKKVYKS